jgi:hypothetical protein
MKFLGKYRVGCQCQQCIGNPKGRAKRKMRKAQKSSARQIAKKEITFKEIERAAKRFKPKWSLSSIAADIAARRK